MANFLPSNLTRYVDDARREVNSALDRVLSQTGSGSLSAEMDGDGKANIFAGFAGGNSPAIDIEETDDDVLVTAELPGVGKEDFNVEIIGDRLRLSGEKKMTRQKRENGYVSTERAYGSFSRSVQLPCEVVAEKADAELKNGVLHITLPKVAEAKVKTTKIKVK
jgi:HSP20 family protein